MKRIAAPVLIVLFAASASAQQWVAGPSLPTGGAPRGYGVIVQHPSGTFLLGGTPFTPGGDAPSHRLHSAGTSWVASTETEKALYHIGAAVDSQGRIIVFGGDDHAGERGEAYVWDEQNGNSGGVDDRRESSPSELFAQAVDAAGRIYALGGGDGAAGGNSDRVERYDAAQDAWSLMTALPAARADAAACVLPGDRILLVGGFDAMGTRTATCFVYDVATDSWSGTVFPAMPAARSGHRAIMGADRKVYVIGGSDGAPTSTTFVLDLASGTWSQGPALTTPREHFGIFRDASGTIWAVGGSTTHSVEKLDTPPCPSIVAQPEDPVAYLGASFGLRVGAEGARPFTYRWRHRGQPIFDGMNSSGSIVVGADTATLVVHDVTAADAGDYDCLVTNVCGATPSAVARVTPRQPADLPASLVGAFLGSAAGMARAVDGATVVGQRSTTHPTYGTLSVPVAWDVTGLVARDLTPSGSVGGAASDVEGGAIVGWWWWPYTTPQGTGYHRHACAWSLPSFTHVELQRSGWEFGAAVATDGTHHVGSARFDEMSTNADGQYWSGSHRVPRSLTPPSAWGSSAAAIDEAGQYGSVHLGFGVVHAFAWQGTAESGEDRNPPGAAASNIQGAGSGQQIGEATIGGRRVEGLWCGLGETFREMTPSGASSARLEDTEFGIQVGSVSTGGQRRAHAWRGRPDGGMDLHALLPAGFASSTATGIDVAADGAVTIVGYGTWNGTTRPVIWQGPGPVLAQSPRSFSAASGATMEFVLRAGASRAGETFVLLGSASGTMPGTPAAPGLLVPLNVDPYLLVFLTIPDAFIAPSVGTLDATGTARARAVVPPGALAGAAPLHLDHAFVLLDGSGQPSVVSPAVGLDVLP